MYKSITDKIGAIVIGSNSIIQDHKERSQAWVRRYKGKPEMYRNVVEMEKTMVLCKISNKLPPMSNTMLNALIARINDIWEQEVYNITKELH